MKHHRKVGLALLIKMVMNSDVDKTTDILACSFAEYKRSIS